MCKEKLAVNVISYIDDNKAKNLIGVANNIFRYVKKAKSMETSFILFNSTQKGLQNKCLSL